MAMPNDEALERMRDAIARIAHSHADHPTTDALLELANFIDEANDGCCGCGWAGVLTEEIREREARLHGAQSPAT
jgi:hypothetical protein